MLLAPLGCLWGLRAGIWLPLGCTWASIGRPLGSLWPSWGASSCLGPSSELNWIDNQRPRCVECTVNIATSGFLWLTCSSWRSNQSLRSRQGGEVVAGSTVWSPTPPCRGVRMTCVSQTPSNHYPMSPNIILCHVLQNRMESWESYRIV